MALKDDVLKYYPQYAWALNIPDVASILEQAVKPENQWDSGRLVAELQNTSWWKGTTPAERESQQRIATDPAAFDQQIRQNDSKLWDLSNKLGLSLSGSTVDSISRQSIQLGWNDGQMQDALVQASRNQGPQGQGNIGQISTNIGALKQQASQYMVNVDDKTAFDWATSIVAGEHTAEDFNEIFKDWSKAKFSYDPQLVQRIDAGFTPEQLFTPQKTAIAKLMEVAPEQVNLLDPKWSQVLDYADPKTGIRRAMTEPETEKLTRSTSEWKQTLNGQQAGSQLLGSITKMFQGQ